MLAADTRRAGPAPKLRDMLPGIRHDFNVVEGEGEDGQIDTFTSIDTLVLLLSGTRSAAFLQQSVRTLDEILPRSRHVVIAGAGHSGPWKAGQGGDPHTIAARLTEFFV